MNRYSVQTDSVTHARGLGQAYIYDWQEDKVVASGDPNAMVALCDVLNLGEQECWSLEDEEEKHEAVECLCYIDK